MEYDRPNENEQQGSRPSDYIGKQYLNSVVGNPAELAQPAKPEKKRGRRWPVSAVLLTILLVLLLAASAFGTVYSSYKVAKLEKTLAQTNPQTANTGSSDNTQSADGKSGKTSESGATFTGENHAISDAEYEIIQKSMQTVVSIDVMQQTAYGSIPTSSGSGVIYSADGYIVTCHHVIDGADKIYVYLNDESSYEAQLVSSDSVSDIAIIKIEATDLPYAVFADSDSLRIGEEVFAIGNMLGQLSNSCTCGCVSGINRSVSIDGITMTLIQTDAAINHGNSGGGLFRRSDGALIGIVNAKSGGKDVDNLAFAIPSVEVDSVIRDLREHGFVTGRPYLGIATKDVRLSNQGLLSYFYTYPQIISIDPDSPAAKSGLEEGDVILEIDGESVSGTSALSSILYSHSIGDTLSITVQRGNVTKTFRVTLGERIDDKN